MSDMRWRIAQDAELSDWKQACIPSEQFSRDGWNAYVGFQDLTLVELERLKPSRCLEIGCGPFGIIHFLDTPGIRVGIDPLMLMFESSGYVDRRGVCRVAGVGEQLPFDNDSFDLIFCINVLDHVQSPQAVVREMLRILRPQTGLLVLEVFGLASTFVPLRPVLDRLDNPHPHHPTLSELKALLVREGGRIEYERADKRRAYRIELSTLRSVRAWRHLVSNWLHLRIALRARKG